MFGLHAPELIIVLVVALLIFGPKKLPEMGSAIGKSIKEFRKGVNEIANPDAKPAVKAEGPKDAIAEASMPVSSADMSRLESTSYASEEVNAETHSN
jgi:sec-independent protein translocase protein TatA